MPTERYRKNAGAVFNLKYHLVFCPKYRKKILGGSIKARLLELINEKAKELEIIIEASEVMPDHVHLFLSCPPTLAPAQVVAQIKGYSSKVLRDEFPYLQRRLPSLWSRSYYIGSVGHVSESTVKKYIENQQTEYQYKQSKKDDDE